VLRILETQFNISICCSNTYAEMAKAVVDVEFNYAQWGCCYSQAHERKLEAQSYEGRVPHPSQIEGGSLG